MRKPSVQDPVRRPVTERQRMVEELEMERMRPSPYFGTKKPNQSEAALRRTERERQEQMFLRTQKNSMRRQRTPESYVSQAVDVLLSVLRIMHFRMNSGQIVIPYERKSTGEQAKRIVKLQEAGTADWLALPECVVEDDAGDYSFMMPRPLWIETKVHKTSSGQTPAQEEFQKRVEDAGHVYLLCRDINVIKPKLKEMGWEL